MSEQVTVNSPIRVFIGTDESQAVACAVLKASILRRTKYPVEFTALCDLKCGVENKFYTGFSFYRWAIPQVCGYRGRAIYLDADIIAQGDIKDLWFYGTRAHTHYARPMQSRGGYYCSVMVIDCERARWPFKEWCEQAAADRGFYKRVMWAHPNSPSAAGIGDLPADFNAMDQSGQLDHTRPLFAHYTAVPTQPWKKPGHPNEQLWLTELLAALDNGQLTQPELERAIANRHVHGGLLRALEKINA